MQTASTDNDIDIIFDIPRLSKPSPKAIKADKFTGNITLKDAKVILQFFDFVERTSEAAGKLIISKPDEKGNRTIAFKRR